MLKCPPYLLEQTKRACRIEFDRQLARIYLKWFMIISAILIALALFIGFAHAQGAPCPAYSVAQIANAIYHAEGGAKTRHPYGILTKYRVTTPRQACINTINHALRDWNGNGDFIEFLGNRYCPPNAHPLNKYWCKNVRYFLEKTR